MESEGSSPAHLGIGSPVPQIPAEYDDLYMQQGSFASQRDFSHDINKKMKMPNRLSVDGKNLHDLEVDNMRAQSSTTQMAAAGMAIPDKITVTGSSQRDVMEDNYSFMNSAGPDKLGYVNVTTPPRVLTVDERFPVVEEEPESSLAPMESADMSRDRHQELTPKKAPKELQLALPAADLARLLRRIDMLEAREKQRQTKDMILYPAIALYLTVRFVSWLLNR